MRSATFLPVLAIITSSTVLGLPLPSECVCKSSPLSAKTIDYILSITANRHLTQEECDFICDPSKALTGALDRVLPDPQTMTKNVDASITDTALSQTPTSLPNVDALQSTSETVLVATTFSLTTSPIPATSSISTIPTSSIQTSTFSPSSVTATSLSIPTPEATSNPLLPPLNGNPSPQQPLAYDPEEEPPPLFDPAVPHPPTLFFGPSSAPISPSLLPRPPPMPQSRMEALAPYEAAVPHIHDDVSPYQPSQTEHDPDAEDAPCPGWVARMMRWVAGAFVLLGLAALVVVGGEIAIRWVMVNVRRRRRRASVGRRAAGRVVADPEKVVLMDQRVGIERSVSPAPGWP